MHKKHTFSLFLLLCSCFCISQNPDINLLKIINRDSSIIADKTFKFFSKSVLPVSIGTPVSILTVGYYNNNETDIRNGYKSAISFLVTSALTASIKFAVHRERPFKKYDFIRAKDKVGPFSFPSGHTSLAFATATSISLAYPQWYVIGPAYLFAGLAAYSRMYLGVHFPIDVLGGIVIGIGSSILVWELDRVMNGK